MTKEKQINLDKMLAACDIGLRTSINDWINIWLPNKNESYKKQAICLNSYDIKKLPVTSIANWDPEHIYNTLIELDGYLQINKSVRNGIHVFLDGKDYTKRLKKIIDKANEYQNLGPKHKCPQKPKKQGIIIFYQKKTQQWFLKVAKKKLLINYCPYCGKKLDDKKAS